jgi:hypothetical protein
MTTTAIIKSDQSGATFRLDCDTNGNISSDFVPGWAREFVVALKTKRFQLVTRESQRRIAHGEFEVSVEFDPDED